MMTQDNIGLKDVDIVAACCQFEASLALTCSCHFMVFYWLIRPLLCILKKRKKLMATVDQGDLALAF